MANPFLNDALKVAVAQMCQSIGFQGIFSTPADVLIDVLHRYLTEVCRVTHRYSEHFGRTEPNLDDLGLAFQDLGITVSDLEEYINNVDSPPFPCQVASVPVRRASNLNFLKPGSREILSRPIHIHEHLPPMYPEKEDEVDPKLENDDATSNLEDGILPIESPSTPSKRPLDADNTSPLKKTKLSLDEEGAPVREIVSVMMTTSGFISSSREGKLPEAAMPNIPMAPQRTSQPAINSPTSGKKKLEKIIRQKNSLGGSGNKGGAAGGGNKNSSSNSGKGNSSGQGSKTPGSKSNKNKSRKEKSCGKSFHPTHNLDGIVGGPHIPKTKPGSAPPNKALPPTLTPIGPVAPGTPQQMPPKLKIPPKIKVPKPSKTPKSEVKIPSLPLVGTPKPKESSKDPEQKKIKKDKEKKNKDGKEKKDKEKKDKSGKEKKEGKKKDKENKKIKKEKDKEKQQEAERERELILKLASSAAVSITSIPPPAKTSHSDNPDKLEGKSKLSIFQKKKKHKGGDIEGDLDKDPHMSRDSSPDLMIDENPSRGGGSTGQWKLMDDDAPSFHEAGGPIKRLDLPLDKPSSGAPVGTTLHQFGDNMSPPGTPTAPRTPEIPQMPQIPQIPHTTKSKNSEKSEKKKNKDKSNKEKKKKDKKQSKNLLEYNSPSRQSTSESETPDRPKTPEAGVNQNDPSAAPFSLNPFPSAPGFIPPFSGFPLFGPFGAPSIRPPMPDLRLSSHSSFVSSHHSSKRPLEDDSVVDDTDNLERPLTPRHDRESSPLPLQVVTHDPVRSPQSGGLLSPGGSLPRPRTPVLMSPQPLIKQKTDKAEKAEKKKEHKKEKKEKDKDKVKKKKDKKDKDKVKDKVEKKKDKEKLKLEKKEKKKGKKDKGEAGSMKLTMKFQGGAPQVRSPQATPLLTQTQQQQQQQQPQQLQQHQQPEPTPKLVIKPVVKHEEPPVLSVQPKIADNQPGSPEIAIAKFSALITRPPKASKQPKEVEVQSVPTLKIKELNAAKGSPSSKKEAKAASGKSKEVPTLKIKPLVQPPKMILPKGADEKKSPSGKKVKEKKEKKEKKSKESKEGANKVVEVSSVTVIAIAPPEPVAAVAVAPAPAPNPPQKKPEHSHTSSHSSQQQQQQQQQQPQQSSQQQQSTGLLTETVGPIGHFVDDQGNEVWICPTCGKQDDGSPMIGCDTCDDWYHWVCVGIQVPPSEDINWYCPRCLSQHKQKGALSDKKKRGRKKK